MSETSPRRSTWSLRSSSAMSDSTAGAVADFLPARRRRGAGDGPVYRSTTRRQARTRVAWSLVGWRVASMAAVN